MEMMILMKMIKMMLMEMMIVIKMMLVEMMMTYQRHDVPMSVRSSQVQGGVVAHVGRVNSEDIRQLGFSFFSQFFFSLISTTN